ncbi:hypothetical protein ACJVC5_05215 [Peredibacter sp. HCB2-198]|uniref:hypothetical protein n=1 Tax=Peredibacter sp. HCB2-198 TaxID=3383025 RepID=UPI0038B4ABFC
MLSKILTSVLVLTLIGCDSKEYKKSDNANVDIVQELNQGESETVINKLTSKNSLSSRERYYLASAQSTSGGIDVYSLYPLLEMQLFRKNALEWSEISKEKNPYLKFMKSQENIDYEKRKKKREEKWKNYLPKIIKKNDLMTEKPTLDHFQKYNSQANLEEYAELDQKLQQLVAQLLKEPGDKDSRRDDLYEAVDKLIEENNNIMSYYDLTSYYQDQLEIESRKQAYLNPEQQGFAKFGKGWEMIFMNILWNTYEAIPIMKQLPSLSNQQQTTITSALENYKKVLNDEEFKEVALKNIAILSGVSLLSVYKESFDLDDIESIEDLMCGFEPAVLTDNYSLIRERIIFLSDTYASSGSTDLDRYKEEFEKVKAELPESLTPEEKARYVEDIENFKIGRCF